MPASLKKNESERQDFRSDFQRKIYEIDKLTKYDSSLTKDQYELNLKKAINILLEPSK